MWKNNLFESSVKIITPTTIEVLLLKISLIIYIVKSEKTHIDNDEISFDYSMIDSFLTIEGE